MKSEEWNEIPAHKPDVNWVILTQDGDIITSVKRLSDGAVFTLGGYYCIEHPTGVAYGSPTGPITKLWASFEQMRIDVGRAGTHIDMPIIPVNK
jgi:hypothetical protein